MITLGWSLSVIDLREDVKEVIRHRLYSKYPVWHSPGQQTSGYIRRCSLSAHHHTTSISINSFSSSTERPVVFYLQVFINSPFTSFSSSSSSFFSSFSTKTWNLQTVLFATYYIISFVGEESLRRLSPLNVFANHLLVGFQTTALYLLRNYELFVWFSDMFAVQQGRGGGDFDVVWFSFVTTSYI